MGEAEYQRPQDEVDEIRRRLREEGYELILERNGDAWSAALASMTTDSGPRPVVKGASEVAAARNAWRIFLSTPSVNSLRRPARHLA